METTFLQLNGLPNTDSNISAEMNISKIPIPF